MFKIVNNYIEMEEYMLPCLTKKYFGIDCFGCGLQRSVVLLLQGDIKNSFIMYPALYPLLLFFALLIVKHFDKSRDYHKIIVAVGILTGITMFVSYFYKLMYYR